MAGALGFSVHTGWAAVVTIEAPAVLRDRRRLEMMGDEPALPRFVYHAAQDLPLKTAEKRVRDSVARAVAAATAGLSGLVAETGAAAAGVIVGNSLVEAPLAQILASHSLIHAAEGELFRDAIRRACEAVGLTVIGIRARDLEAEAARALRIPKAGVPAHLDKVKAAAGRPWAKDQKDAYLAAAIALRSR